MKKGKIMKVYEEFLKTNNAKLTCYVQTPSEELPHLKKKGAVLVLPGGGFTMCSNREAEPVALAYLQAGYQAFVLDYSTGDRNNRESMAAVFSKALTDAIEAMEYLRANAEALYLIPDKIAVVGFSAGGNLAIALSTLAEPAQRPNAVILGYPSVIPDILSKLGVVQPNLLEKITSETPPMFAFNSRGDEIVPATDLLHLALALAKSNVPYEIHTFLTGIHGLALATTATADEGTDDANVAKWHELSLHFLDNLWKKASSKPIFSISSKIGDLLANEAATAAINEVLPGVADRPEG